MCIRPKNRGISALAAPWAPAAPAKRAAAAAAAATKNKKPKARIKRSSLFSYQKIHRHAQGSARYGGQKCRYDGIFP